MRSLLLFPRLLLTLLFSLPALIMIATAGSPSPAQWHLLQTIRTDDWGHAPFALSPDGHLLASCTESQVLLRDLPSGRLIARLPIPHSNDWQGGSSSLLFSPDGRRLICATGAAAFSPDGRSLALGAEAVAENWEVKAIRSAALSVSSNLSPDLSNSSLSSLSPSHFGSAHGRFAVWDVATGHQKWNAADGGEGFWAGTKQSLSLAFSPDGQTIASGSSGGGLHLWNAEAGTLLHTFTAPPATWQGASKTARRGGILAHPGRVTSVVFSPDGKTLVSAGGDGSVRVWNPASGILKRIILSPAGVQALSFQTDGRTLVAAFRQEIAFLSLPTGQRVRTLHGHDEDVLGLILRPEGNTLWSAAADGTLKRWDIMRGLETATFGRFQQAAVSEDGTTLAYCRGDNTITLQNMASGKVRCTLRGFSLPERSGSFSHSSKMMVLSPDGKFLAGGAFTTQGFVDHSGVFHSRVLLWDTSSTQKIHQWEEEPGAQVVFSPDSQRLVEMTADLTDTPSSLRVRAVPQGGLIQTWLSDANVHGPFLGQPKIELAGAALVFGPHGRRLLAASGPAGPGIVSDGHGVVSGLWNVSTGRLVRVLEGGGSFTYDASPNGRYVAGVGDGFALWDGWTGRRRWLQPLKKEQGVLGVSVSPDGLWVAAGEGPDGWVMERSKTPVFVRDGLTGVPAAQLDGPTGGLIWLSFTKDGRRIIAASHDGVVRVWGLK